MNCTTRTFTVADDELSRLVRFVEPLGPGQEGSPAQRKPVEEVLEKLLIWFLDQLTSAGWPDPTAVLVLRDGHWTGEAIDPQDVNLREPDASVEYIRSATAIRHELESRGLAFGDTWYCAAMVDNLLSALANTDNERHYAMVAVGWWLRDWEWRRKYGQKARGKLRQEGSLPKARDARAVKQGLDPDWHEDARQDARAIRAKDSKRSRWSIAGDLAEKFGRSQKQVSKVIKSSVP